MITAATPEELPPGVPPVLVEALNIARDTHTHADANNMWGRQPAYVFHYKMRHGELKAHYVDLAEVTQMRDTALLDEQLRVLIYDAVPRPTPGRHLGTAACAEATALTGDDAEALMQEITSSTGKALQRVIERADRQGRIEWRRVTMGAFVGGWKFEYETFRRRPNAEITVYEPDEQADLNDTFELVLRLDEKMATRT